MATTGFWPVKGSLKTVIDYADNPDKTTNPKYLDDDLAQVLRYTENDDKTDQRLFVSGVNCTAERAYEEMKAVQTRFGMKGTNVAYHGYQSFKTGEVTPEVAHQIGVQTARQMWGDRYQVVVTTHLNTKTVHNHMVVNAVSFRDGKKFQNHISDHIRLREVSDELCRECGLSVLEDASFYKTESRSEFRARQRGGMTHRDILKSDIEECLRYAMTRKDLIRELTAMGYIYDSVHDSIRAPDWERPIRLDRLGYSIEIIQARLDRNFFTPGSVQDWNDFHLRPPSRVPLLELEETIEKKMERSDNVVQVLVDLTFLIVITLLQWAQAERDADDLGRLLSPSLREEMRHLEEIKAEYALMAEQSIHTVDELSMFTETKTAQIKALEQERQSCRNQLRRPKSPEVETDLKQRIHDISERLKPMRKDLKAAERISKRYPKLVKLLDTERQMEAHALHLVRNKGRVR
jgi:hypothetical protein